VGQFLMPIDTFFSLPSLTPKLFYHIFPLS
jgi:hypothetical protein